MPCPDCDGELVSFAVPPSLREYAPDSADAAALCTHCLRVHSAVSTAEFAWGPLPTGEAGVATALLLARLDSLALARREIEALLDYAEATGGDVFLALDRLQALEREGELEPPFDLGRRSAQLADLR